MRNEWRNRERETPRSLGGKRWPEGESNGEDWVGDHRGGHDSWRSQGRSGHGSEFYGSEYNHSSSQDTGGMRGSDWQSRNRDPSHDDYMHWREQQMSKLDEEYHHWRGERRKKFAEDFDKWRTERSAMGQGSGIADSKK